jgi:putative PIN family toxin of toxin-antitoxin system
MTLRVVFDANVIVSAALLADSAPRRAFDKALDEGRILISAAVLLELAEVLGRRKFDKYLLEEERIRFLMALLREAELIEIGEQVTDCRDPKDNKFLELAVAGRADFIISGDDDLLMLNPFRNISVLKPEAFLKRLSSESD